jgi:glycosyltransferase involved in cell wall biosynthesis
VRWIEDTPRLYPLHEACISKYTFQQRNIQPEKLTVGVSRPILPLTMPSSAIVSVIIVNHNTVNLILQNLESLARKGDGPDLEILVVDTGSTDGSVETIRHAFPAATVISTENIGFARAVNLGADKTSGKRILVLNGDVVLSAGEKVLRTENSGRSGGSAVRRSRATLPFLGAVPDVLVRDPAKTGTGTPSE